MNLGCGQDGWGDVRVDIDTKTQTGAKGKPNLIADAHHLPFRDDSFSMVHCWHMLEHVRNPPAVIFEIRRVSKHWDIRFPVDEGYYMLMLIGIVSFNYEVFLMAFRTLKGRFHLWKLSIPGSIVSDRTIVYPIWAVSGRKRRFLRWLARAYFFERVVYQ